MKKYLILLVIIMGISRISHLYAQLYQGDRMLHFHIGYTGRWYKHVKKNLSLFYTDTTENIQGSVEGLMVITVPMLEGGYSWMANDKWGAGFNLGYYSSFFLVDEQAEGENGNQTDSAHLRITLERYNVFITPFARWYFYNEYKFQSYLTAKLHLGLNLTDFKLMGDSSSSDPVHFHLFLPLPDVYPSVMIGANYFPIEHLGINLEAGYGKSYVNLGIIYKM